VDKQALFAPRLPEEDVEVPGGTVRVRGLSRHLLSVAMVAPTLTAEEVALWQAASLSTEIESVVSSVVRLSGLEDNSAKEAYKSTGDES
jgi:hypothetical protein